MPEIDEKATVGPLDGRAPERTSSPSPAHAIARPAPPPGNLAVYAPIILSDSPEGSDALDATAIVQPLAQLCVTAQVQTPFLAGILGGPGAGKSFALNQLARAIEGSSGSAGGLPTVVARVEASEQTDAPVALASAAYVALDRMPRGVDYSALLDDLTHAGGDPLRAAKAASDRHEEVVRKLESERTQRDEVEARAARISDTLLFETPGSRVDVFARARRGAIDSRLRRFDVAGSDSAASYRDLVRDLATLGSAGRASVVIRSIWAYSSQRRLLFWAVVAFVLGFGIDLLRGQGAPNAIQEAAAQQGLLWDWTANVARWISGHNSWFETASKVLYALCALALAVNLWRAIAFSSLLLRGAQLLSIDIRDRRRDLEGRLGRLEQRIAALSAEAEAVAERAEAAARRAGGKASYRAPGPEFMDAGQGPGTAARAFLAALGERISKGSAAGAPGRFVFVIDNIDALSTSAAVSWIDAAQSVIGAGAVGVMALDPQRLAATLGGRSEARRRFDKWLQVVINLPRRVAPDGERLMARLLATDEQPLQAPPADFGAALFEPLPAIEIALLTVLAPLAVHSPREAKRFFNAYRLARCASAPRPVVALMLAVALADDEAQTQVRDRFASTSGELGDFDGPAALARAVRSARAANNGAITIAEARAAEAIARRYTLTL